MQVRRIAVAVALTAGIIVPAATLATSATAKPATRPAAVQKAKPKATPPRPTKAPAKPVKASFSANGTVTAVGTGTLTLAVKGGTKDVKGASVTVAVPSTAKIVAEDAPATLADVQVGYRVSVTGTKVGTVYTATRVQVHLPEPTPSPTTPTEEPTTPVDEPTTPVEEPTA